MLFLPPRRRQAAMDIASSMAWVAPLADVGKRECAAFPSWRTKPTSDVHVELGLPEQFEVHNALGRRLANHGQESLVPRDTRLFQLVEHSQGVNPTIPEFSRLALVLASWL
jgi:hypothetical protein